MYWRENRTLLHTGQTYHISESHVCKIVRGMETALLQDTRFHLSGKKSLLTEQAPRKIRLDVTETPTQRPQTCDLRSRNGGETKRFLQWKETLPHAQSPIHQRCRCEKDNLYVLWQRQGTGFSLVCA